MNWLAHLLLAQPTSAYRTGCLLPDLLTRGELLQLPAHFLPGVQCHHRIDAFTDSHPAVRQSISRVRAPYRRFGGILIDIYYDHLLASDWERYSAVPLPMFAQEMYSSLEAHYHELPAHALPRLQAMAAQNWLGSYRNIDDIREAVSRLGHRLRKPVELKEAVDQLLEQEHGLRTDFEQFFPELARHVAQAPSTSPPV